VPMNFVATILRVDRKAFAGIPWGRACV